MAKLLAVVENLDELDPALQELYVPAKIKGADGKDKDVFALDLGDSVKEHPSVLPLQHAHERQKTLNNTLRTRVQELEARLKDLPDDFTAETLAELQAKITELEEAGTEPDPKKRDELAHARRMLEQKITGLEKKLADADRAHAEETARLNRVIERMLVDDGLTKYLVEVGIKAGPYMKAAKALLRENVKVVKDEAADPPYRAVVETDMGEVELVKFVQDWAGSDEGKEFVEKPKGSGAREGNGNAFGDNPFSDKSWNLTQQQELMQANPARANQMLVAAGFKTAEQAQQAYNAKHSQQRVARR